MAASKRKSLAPAGNARAAKRKAPEPATAAEPEPTSVQHPSHGQVLGDLFVFGDGDCGQLGLGEDVTEKKRPFPLVVGTGKVRQVACGGMHTVALSGEGHVWTWGVNDEGALGRETAGEVWENSGLATGNPQDPYVPGQVKLPEKPGKVVQIAAGDSHTLALCEDGSVYGWGTYRDGSGVMGFSPSTRIQLVPVQVYKPSKPEEQIVRIASGADHSIGLTKGGKILSWGSGQQGQLGRVGERIGDRAKASTLLQPHAVPFKRARGFHGRFMDVNCGTYDTFAISEEGAIYTWGLNNYGQLGLEGQAPVFAPALVKKLEGKGVTSVRAGQHHTLAITAEGGLLSFGRPTYGRLGRGAEDVDVVSDVALPEPQPVAGLDGIKIAGAAAGLAVSGAFSEEGEAYFWGFGTNSQLGKGDDDTDEVAPKLLGETQRMKGRKVVQMEFGGQHAAVLTVLKEET